MTSRYAAGSQVEHVTVTSGPSGMVTATVQYKSGNIRDYAFVRGDYGSVLWRQPAVSEVWTTSPYPWLYGRTDPLEDWVRRYWAARTQESE